MSVDAAPTPTECAFMADAIFVAIGIAFFGVMYAYAVACEGL
jgi:hypothetical protein